MYSHMHKVQKENKIASLKKAQDKSYIKYFWKAAKDIPNSTFDESDGNPSFSKVTADKFYSKRYQNSA